jgi:monomeric isocitrate dehydrogenase
VYDRYQRFEDKDLGISIENQHAQNAYTVLGLQPDVAPSQLTALIQELHDTGYQLPGVPMSVVRNAVYQLQAPEGKSEYDEYLQAKMDPSLAQELRQKVASEDDARVLGTVATGVRMHALLYCIREASGI